MSAVPIIEIQPQPAAHLVLDSSVPRFLRHEESGLELRVEATSGATSPVLQAWCIGRGPDVHRVCYSLSDVETYFRESGVSSNNLDTFLQRVKKLHEQEMQFYR